MDKFALLSNSLGIVHHITIKTDVFLAGITNQLSMLIAHRMNCLQYIQCLKQLIARKNASS